MSNKKEVVKIIKEKIKLNVPKVEIEKDLSSKYKSEEYKILADFPEAELKQKYKKYNDTLIVFLIIAMIFRFLDALSFSSDFGPILLILLVLVSLGIPAYIISELRFYRKSTYGILILIGIGSLGNFLKTPENLQYIYIVLELIIVLFITIISMFLFKKIYPKIIIKKENVIQN